MAEGPKTKFFKMQSYFWIQVQDLSGNPWREVVDQVDRDVGMPVRKDLVFDTLGSLCLLLLGGLGLAGEQVGRLGIVLLLEPVIRMKF